MQSTTTHQESIVTTADEVRAFEALRASGKLGSGMQARANRIARSLDLAVSHPSLGGDYNKLLTHAASIVELSTADESDRANHDLYSL